MNSAHQTTARIAVFASGTGSNADRIIRHSRRHSNAGFSVALIVTNNPSAGVLNVAANFGIDTLVIDKAVFVRGNAYVDELKQAGIDFVVLAGFLWKVPATLIHAYQNKIINIHPALLPAYGGKGMYGQHVHAAVIASGDTESGITIHWVDEQYDHGAVIFQAKCPVESNDTPESLAAKIHVLEHQHYPKIIAKLLLERSTKNDAS